MRFIFVHHEPLGPITVEQLYHGTHSFSGSVGRMRILFWMASAGHDVHLVGNVQAGSFRGVKATPGIPEALRAVSEGTLSEPCVVILSNAPPEPLWSDIRSATSRPIILWAGNPFHHRWMDRLVDKSLSRIVCVSQYHRDLYRIHRGFESVEVIYSGVDLDILDQASLPADGRGDILFCSIPRRTKGFHRLMHAWRIVHREDPTVRLRVLGAASAHAPWADMGKTGVLDPDVESEFPDFFGNPPDSLRHAGITLTGFLPALDAYGALRACGVAVVNSCFSGSFETYCRSAVEAQAVGVPVVGAARGSLPEVVSDGSTGILVHRPHEKHLAAALLRLAHDPDLRAKLGGNGPAWSRPLADYATIAQTWEEVAQRALNGRPSPCRARLLPDLLRHTGFGRIRSAATDCIRGTRAERMILKLLRR